MHLLEKIKDKVIQHAKDEYPNECCGLAVVIRGKLNYFPCKNIASGKQFVIDPLDYSHCEDAGEIVGVCHSHIDESPIPSDADKIGIEETKVPWLIVNPSNESFTITEPSGFVLPLIGREFKHGHIDCLTLIRDYYKQVLNISMPDFVRKDNWWLTGGNMYRDNFEKCGFILVGGSEYRDIKKHDVIVMQVGSPVPNHGAVYIGDGVIMQHCQGRLSSRDIYGGYWQKVTNMVLRHKELI